MTNAAVTPTTNDPTPTPTADALVADLNGDLELEFRSIVQYVNHVATITGPEYTNTGGELKVHLGQEHVRDLQAALGR